MNDAALLPLDLIASLGLPAPTSDTSDSPTAPYGVASALRATIQAEGSFGAKFLYACYDYLNKTLFGGALPPAAILWTAPSSPRAYADYITTDDHGIKFRIRMSPSIRQYGPKFVFDVLLHEMIHLVCAHVERDEEHGYRGHGPRFAHWCNTFGRMMKLAEVSPKGRGGKLDCAQWPINVRPAGYYGENDPRVAKQKKAKTQDEGAEREPSERKTSKAERYEAAMREALTLLRAGDTQGADAILSAALQG